ncbi:MAG: NifB/NifX family molybdenum-iron cluster-binding protein [bacterium]
MKVVISSRGKELKSMLDPRFGRAPYLVFYDTEADGFEVIDNGSATQLAHGAGIQTAQSVLGKNPDLVVSGNFGPKASEVLKAANIKLAVCPELTVGEVLELVKKGEVTPFEG